MLHAGCALEEMKLIGNCQVSGLIDTSGNYVWCCMPRFDSEPLFGSILGDGAAGVFRIGPIGSEKGTQRYIENTNVLQTFFNTQSGTFCVTDFAPRFRHQGRLFRPTQLVRIITPLQGAPIISAKCSPILGWSKKTAVASRGSNHINFDGFDQVVRLTSDIPISFYDGSSFILSEKKYIIFSMGTVVEEELAPLCERFLAQTVQYWRVWVKQCAVPPDYQAQVIRSALALKLHCFEDTGAIVASMTTSIPESPGSDGRCWDYRYCWLRDAYYVLGAFRLLGLFEEREQFLHFLLGIAASSEDNSLHPLYKIDGRADVNEQIVSHWSGYRGLGPVRIGNAASQQKQNDIYGELVLCLAPIFLDDRFTAERTDANYTLLYNLAKKAVEVVGTPDEGIWEYRNISPTVQTFSSLMSWAGVDRFAAICKKRGDDNSSALFESAAQIIREQILAKAWNAELGAFVGHYESAVLDASLLQMPYLRFLDGDFEKVSSTINAIYETLQKNGFIMRYAHFDGIGYPQTAFLICTFWLIEAIAITGNKLRAKAILDQLLQAIAGKDLLSEDIDVMTGELWGNYPQAYSHVGLIHAAFAVSRRWSEVL